MFTGVQERLFKVVYISTETLDQIDKYTYATFIQCFCKYINNFDIVYVKQTKTL